MGLKKGTLENLLINSSKTTADKDLQTGDSARANRLLGRVAPTTFKLDPSSKSTLNSDQP